MAINPDRREAADQKRRQYYHQHFKTGRIALLILMAVSVINQLLLVLKVDYHLLFSAAVPYYLNWLAQRLGGSNGVTFLKVVAIVVTLVCYGGYCACWILSAQQREFLKTALMLYCMDSLMLLIFAFVLIENPASCLLEILVHLVGIWLLYDGYRSVRLLNSMDGRRRRRSPAESRPSTHRGGSHG